MIIFRSWALSEPIWVYVTWELNQKIDCFNTRPLIRWFLVFCRMLSVRYIKKIEAKLKFKVGGGCFWAHMYADNVFFWKMFKFWFFYEGLKPEIEAILGHLR
jgi:hypothetical protein